MKPEINIAQAPDTEARKLRVQALHIKTTIERYWRDEFKRYDVEVKCIYDPATRRWTHTSNLVNGLPPKRTYASYGSGYGHGQEWYA